MHKILSYFLIISLICINSLFAGKEAKYHDSQNIKTEHEIETTLLFDEIYDINISEGHYRVSVEILMSFEGDTKKFLNQFGDVIIHGTKMDKFLEEIWYPEFFVANAENPRVTHYKTLDVMGNKYELFERFEADLSIDADMKSYPFGNLDLFMDIAAYSGNESKMQWKPKEVLIGHHDVHHKVVKGNWVVKSKNLEEEKRSSLNHGGKERFSYLISHVHLEHNPNAARGKILFPLGSIIILSILFNFTILSKFERIRCQLILFLVLPALKFALADDIPTTHYINFTDGLFIIATMIVFVSLVMGVYGNNLEIMCSKEKLESLDKKTKIIISSISIISLILLIFITII